MSAVVREHLCPDCANTGQREHPDWARMRERWQSLHPDAPATPDRDFVQGYFWRLGIEAPPPRFMPCDCRRGDAVRVQVLPAFAVEDARIIAGGHSYGPRERVPDELELSYYLGGRLVRRRMTVKRLAIFLELAEQKLGLHLAEEISP